LQMRGFVKESKGAQCFFTPKIADIPLMIVKGDGGYGYDSTDLAAICHRLRLVNKDWLIYVTDVGQAQHFHMVFDAAEQLGWHRPPATRCDHLGLGLVQGEDGKKFKTRSGETVKLMSFLDEAVAKALEEIKARVEEQRKSGGEVFLETQKEQENAAEKLGCAAVRYFDIIKNPTSDYVFNYERVLDFKGKTAVLHLFYAYAGLCDIQRKAGIDATSLSMGNLAIKEIQERDLALCILRFPDVIEEILADLHLNHLAEYLSELCTVLTAFYQKCKVIDSPQQESRLILCAAARKILEKSFYLIGFEPLEKF
jgi:arginyl-tRNA synthetase